MPGIHEQGHVRLNTAALKNNVAILQPGFQGPLHCSSVPGQTKEGRRTSCLQHPLLLEEGKPFWVRSKVHQKQVSGSWTEQRFGTPLWAELISADVLLEGKKTKMQLLLPF